MFHNAFVAAGRRAHGVARAYRLQASTKPVSGMKRASGPRNTCASSYENHSE
jgi:hypothetical protein